MKIEVAKSDLESALEVPRMAVGSGDDLTSHYLFRVKGGQVEVLTYDQRVFGYSRVQGAKVDADDDEAFTVDAWRLDKWLGAVQAAKPLILSSDGEGVVTVAGGRSKIRLRSLDPKKFRFWDGLYESAQEVGKIDPGSLARALTCSRWFVGADDTNKPELCQVEAVEGVLWATDRRALTSVEMPRLPDLAIRVPGGDVSRLVKFLTDKRTQEELSIEIRQAERPFEEGGGGCAFFHRPDGTYLGVMRPMSTFPTLNVDRDAEDQATLKINREEFNAALDVLLAGAPKGFPSVTFTHDTEKGVVTLQMPCEAGDVVTFPLQQVTVTNGDAWDSDFTIDYAYLKGIADTFKLTELDLGVNKRGRGGYVSFRYSDDEEDGKGNRYYSVIVWRT
jgi:hypothetical protein